MLQADKKTIVAVIGLGYVGLPVALAFARKGRVIGFDIDRKRIEMMQQGKDPSWEQPAGAFEHCDIAFTADSGMLRQANFFIVT
ncbi:MAG TPA: hypothetical protein VLD19_20715, partial [Chitinophagaceae bacterium]|nr:hypothetical protein [Chitinophagaceae bacterium]